jgi:hypothetical protein
MALPAYVDIAYDEFRLAQNALTDAIQRQDARTKVARALYPFATGCMALGQMRQAELAGDAGARREHAEGARQDFITVQNRLGLI